MTAKSTDEAGRRSYWTQQLEQGSKMVQQLLAFPVSECSERFASIPEAAEAAAVAEAGGGWERVRHGCISGWSGPRVGRVGRYARPNVRIGGKVSLIPPCAGCSTSALPFGGTGRAPGRTDAGRP